MSPAPASTPLPVTFPVTVRLPPVMAPVPASTPSPVTLPVAVKALALVISFPPISTCWPTIMPLIEVVSLAASYSIFWVFLCSSPILASFAVVLFMESLISASVVVTPASLLIFPVTFSAPASTVAPETVVPLTVVIPVSAVPSSESLSVLSFKALIAFLFVVTSPARASIFSSTPVLV